MPVRSHFVKRSALLTLGKEFKFEFPHVVEAAAATATTTADTISIEKMDLNKVDESGDDTSGTSAPPIAAVNGEMLSKVLATSNNSFRFNFNVQSD